MIYIVETNDGDVWHYDNLDEAQRAIYIFGGKITKSEDHDFTPSDAVKQV